MSEHSKINGLEAPADNEKTLHMLAFYLGKEIFCIDVSFVQEVILYAQPTPLNNLPRFVRGLLSVRGQMIPIFDLADLLGLHRIDPQLQSAILLITCEDVKVGLIVEKIYNLLWFDRSACVEVPANTSGLEMDYIDFAISQGERLIFALNAKKVITSWYVDSVKTSIKEQIKHDG